MEITLTVRIVTFSHCPQYKYSSPFPLSQFTYIANRCLYSSAPVSISLSSDAVTATDPAWQAMHSLTFVSPFSSQQRAMSLQRTDTLWRWLIAPRTSFIHNKYCSITQTSLVLGRHSNPYHALPSSPLTLLFPHWGPLPTDSASYNKIDTTVSTWCADFALYATSTYREMVWFFSHLKTMLT